MRNLFKLLSNRILIFGLSIILQALTLIIIIYRFSNYMAYFYGLFTIISILAVLYIVNKNGNPSYKIAWIIPIMIFPVFGGLFYLLFGGITPGTRNRKKMKVIEEKTTNALGQNEDIIKIIEQENMVAANQSRYIEQNSMYPVYMNTTSEYLAIGESKFKILLEELQKAEKYIFLEYFIIEEGIMWNSILDVLKEKASQGIDVRIIYDDIGCLMKLPYRYDKKLEKMGIKCEIFNPFIPILSNRHNHRDHRKIVVIDGHTAITGGINLADEYINAKRIYGHWKDSGILIKGDAVWSLTVMFLTVWDYLKEIDEDFNEYKPDIKFNKADGFVQPFSDSPLDNESVGESVYLNLITQAQDYIYINTPYLILDSTMTRALCLASQRGVNVKIVTPHIPDKWYVHSVSRSNYQVLIEAGIEIYEYTPGFMHSKTFVVDDKYGVVGTINLDYRSLFLHFECGVWLYKTNSIKQLKDDYLKTLKQCQKVTLEDCKNVKLYIRLGRSILRLFAPLM
ncbi:cardiolipin synthase [Tissierella sp. Yu-01]|uniref:cardiolipin synthase n=1 Tax=Tissierella sp. Yu-01 TaxID=3035694 RepID=UPI00240E044B|nr:cardiolipin synthase [Tissierella sp. Yu-01]WFA08860.1 cardiolipin synthase [Tissierella sp. Yu-01]